MANESSRKTIQFSTGHLASVLAGVKKISVRRFRPEAHMLRDGELFYGAFPDTGTPLLLIATARTQVTTAGAVPDTIAREDGYRDTLHMLNEMRTYYQDFAPETQVGIIRFEPEQEYQPAPQDGGLGFQDESNALSQRAAQEDASQESSGHSAEKEKTAPRYHLAVIEQDLAEDPNCILPVSASKIALGIKLTHMIIVSDDDEIPDTEGL